MFVNLLLRVLTETAAIIWSSQSLKIINKVKMYWFYETFEACKRKPLDFDLSYCKCCYYN